jgi:hypothetical protein
VVLRHGVLHDLLDSLDIIDPILEGIDDFNVLDVLDSVPDITKIFYVVSEDLIVLLLDGLQSFSCGWTLVCALKFSDELGT